MQYHVDPEGSEEIELVALDGFVRERGIRPTLIKMDIEGAEVEAIRGARKPWLSVLQGFRFPCTTGRAISGRYLF